MFAVIRTGGKQYKVAPNDVIAVEKLDGEPGATVEFAEVLMVGDGATVSTGTPLLAGASVSATLVEQRRADKIIVFKKKRRQNYRRKKGHRQYQTLLRITEIHAQVPNKPLHEFLVERNFAKEDEVLAALAEEFGLELVDLTHAVITPDVLTAMPQKLVHRKNLMPVARHNGTLVVAHMPLYIDRVARTGNQLILSWQGGSGRYQLQTRSDLTTGDWQNLGAPTTGTSATNTLSDHAFFRVLSLPNP